MKKRVAKTSINAYTMLDPTSLYGMILNLLSDGKPRCIADIAYKLNLERSTVSARMNELRHAGALEYFGKLPSIATNITSMHFKAKPQDQLKIWI